MKVVSTSRKKTKLSETSKLRYESQIYVPYKIGKNFFFKFWFAHYALIFQFRSTTKASKEAFFHAIFETCLILSVRLKLSPPGHFKEPWIRKYPRGCGLYQMISWGIHTYISDKITKVLFEELVTISWRIKKKYFRRNYIPRHFEKLAALA